MDVTKNNLESMSTNLCSNKRTTKSDSYEFKDIVSNFGEYLSEVNYSLRYYQLYATSETDSETQRRY